MTSRLPAPAPPQSSVPHRLDAGLWFAFCVLALFAIPVGFVSNDGLGHSRSFASGEWPLNPNHLLFEPLGAGWQSLWARLAPGRAGVDALKLLSALAGAAAVALFRLRVVPLVPLLVEKGGRSGRIEQLEPDGSRWRANYATAWVGLSSAFLRLWVSDEIHMIQMPFVIGLAGEALRLLAVPSWRGGLRAGVAAGLATLAFISNALLAVSLALSIVLFRPAAGGRRPAHLAVAGLAVAALLVTLPVFLFAAGRAVGERGAVAGTGGTLAWLSHGRLGGDGALARGESGYGLELGPRGLGEALLRAGYGAASALVDLQPLAAAVRDRERPTWAAILGGLACLAGAAVMLRGVVCCLEARSSSPLRRVGLLAFVWGLPILGFGVLWNNSDDQFYFQLAPIFGLLAAISVPSTSRRKLWLLLGLGALFFNLADVTARRILYPRAERIAELSAATDGACLVVVPGFDEAELVLRLAPQVAAPPRLSIVDLATRWPPEEGLARLERRISDCIRSGRSGHGGHDAGRVVFVDLFDTPPARNPWKYLRRLGYSHGEVLSRLEPVARASPTVPTGPFLLRSIP